MCPWSTLLLVWVNPIFIVNVLLYLLQHVDCTLQNLELQFFCKAKINGCVVKSFQFQLSVRSRKSISMFLTWYGIYPLSLMQVTKWTAKSIQERLVAIWPREQQQHQYDHWFCLVIGNKGGFTRISHCQTTQIYIYFIPIFLSLFSLNGQKLFFVYHVDWCALKGLRDVHHVSLDVWLLCFVILFCPIYGSSVFPA